MAQFCDEQCYGVVSLPAKHLPSCAPSSHSEELKKKPAPPVYVRSQVLDHVLHRRVEARLPSLRAGEGIANMLGRFDTQFSPPCACRSARQKMRQLPATTPARVDASSARATSFRPVAPVLEPCTYDRQKGVEQGFAAQRDLCSHGGHGRPCTHR